MITAEKLNVNLKFEEVNNQAGEDTHSSDVENCLNFAYCPGKMPRVN